MSVLATLWDAARVRHGSVLSWYVRPLFLVLCTLQKLRSVHARKRGRQRRPGPPVHEDLVRREFTAERPNRLWLTDTCEARWAESAD